MPLENANEFEDKLVKLDNLVYDYLKKNHDNPEQYQVLYNKFRSEIIELILGGIV
jgi:hypothetical protein